jgi:hypothetical protein
MRAVISVANVAARSGKTTVAVNLAAEISKRGLRTLLVDADPQARATPFFIKPEQVVRTLSDILLPTTAREAPCDPLLIRGDGLKVASRQDGSSSRSRSTTLIIFCHAIVTCAPHPYLAPTLERNCRSAGSRTPLLPLLARGRDSAGAE